MAVAPSYANNIPGGVHIPGDLKEVIVTGTVGAADTYVTGGFALTPAALGLTSIAVVEGVTFSTGHWGIYDAANQKVKVFSAAATELANASTALQNATFVIQALGK